MAETEVQTPMPAPVAPAAAAPASLGTDAPDVSAAPAAAPAIPDTGSKIAATQSQMAPFEAKEQAALQSATDLEKPAPPAAPVPHARLLAMISGLATGLGAASTSLATHGREGGAQEVQQVQAAEQQQKIQAQQAAQAQKNAQIQQQLMVADTNHKLAQNIFLMATMPNELTQSDLAVKKAQTELAGAQQGQAITGADFAATHGGLDPEAFHTALSSHVPVSGQAAPVNQFFTVNANQQLGAAAKVLGPDDPFVQNLQKTLADPAHSAGDLYFATGQLKNQVELQSKATDELVKKETAEKGNRPTDLNDATGRLTQAQQKYKATPSPDTKKAVDDARAAQGAFLAVDRQQKQIAQDIQNGDPTVIGAALADGTYAPSQVLSARSMSKPFYAKVIAAANATAKAQGVPEILGPNGTHTGQYFNASKAEAQYKYSTNIQNQNVLNKILTLTEPGGDIDILNDAITALPKLPEKTVNKIFNAVATEFGSPAATNYHMALYNLASLLANVQTGGVPTQGEIQEQLDLMHDANSKGQLNGAIDIARKDIGARGTSMVANNPYLRNQYPSLAGTQTSSANQPAPEGHQIKLENGDTATKKNGKWIDDKTGVEVK